jgi:undecaprenyl pyrophosphate phosphatase UppP
VSAFERWSIWLGSLLVTLTGLVYLGMKYLLPEPAEFSIIRHPLQPLVLKLHIVAAPLLVFAVGTVATRHVWRHMMAGTRQGRLTGWSAAISTVPMVLTGYLLQAFTSGAWLRSMAIAHIATGLLYGGGILLHQFVVRRSTAGETAIHPRRLRRLRFRRRATGRRVLR